MAKFIAVILIILGVATIVVLWRSSPDGVIARLSRAVLENGWRKIPVFQQSAPTPTKAVIRAPDSGTKIATTLKAPPKPVAPSVPKLHDVRIASVSSGFSGDVTTIVLRNNTDTPWNVTGWKIKSKIDEFVLPKGIPDFQVSLGGLPAVPIILRKNDRFNIYTNKGALAGAFRVNKCFGYITRTTNFVPSISASCPSIIPKNIADFTSKCQDFLRQIRSCEQPSVNPPISLTDFECNQYLKTISYAGCVDAHRFDKDFLGSEWHLWIGDPFGKPRKLVDPSHDKMQLISDTGVVIDEYVY